MRGRHLVLTLVAISAVLIAVRAAGPTSGGQPALTEAGVINVTATRSGSGAWVPYTVTVRNLGDHGDFSGRLLLVKNPDSRLAPPAVVSPINGGPAAPLPFPAAAGVGGPDGGYEFPITLSPRHKRTLNFFAPSDFAVVVVRDAADRPISEARVDDRGSLGVGLLSESQTLTQALEPILIGDLRLRLQVWDERQHFPSRAVDLSGLSAIVLDRYDTSRLTPPQIDALREFVGLGGELVLAGGVELARTISRLPPELLPFLPTGETVTTDLAALGELAATRINASAQVAIGSPSAGATVFLDSAQGRPLGVESRYGAGRIIALLFDPDPRLPGAGDAERALASLSFEVALARGIEHMPGSAPMGRTLIDTARLSDGLLPRPSDSPFPAPWLVGLLMAAYLAIVLPANYLLLRRLGRAALTWLTAPALAIMFTLSFYGAGQVLQAGVRDQDLQFVRLGPDGVASAVDVHGLVFPGRGEHRVEFGSGTTAAPLTVYYESLTPSCRRCPFPVAQGSTGVEEHVLAGGKPQVVERGVVYGGVRALGSGTAGRGDLRLEARLNSDSGVISGTIANTGGVRVKALLIYTYYRGAYRGAPVAPALEPGEEVSFITEMSPLGDLLGNLPAGIRLTAGERAGLQADEIGRRSLSHPGQVAVVGFAAPLLTTVKVDGASPQRRVTTAFGLPVEVSAATGNVGNLANVRLAATQAASEGGYVDTYDIALPAISAPVNLHFDFGAYANVEIYDWVARSWRVVPVDLEAQNRPAGQSRLAPSETRGGLVRVRVREANVSWGAQLHVRFLEESP